VIQLGILEKFLDLAKQKLNPNVSMADEIALLLNMSKDSAYRRLRGETDFTFDEIGMLSQKFNISLDSLLEIDDKNVTFNYRALDHQDFSFENYLKSILEDLEFTSTFTINTPAGFINAAIHSPHPYPDGTDEILESNLTYILAIPIIIDNEKSELIFDEVVLIEPGDEGSSFGETALKSNDWSR